MGGSSCVGLGLNIQPSSTLAPDLMFIIDGHAFGLDLGGSLAAARTFHPNMNALMLP